ncbi:hypothetical protein GGS23DRAFT_376270 [Durotheca rogersii]|uniref:uncharacterized protein n=1 Tax=Durotheca rogersii TaxID=419775 RepID=UPI00221EAA1A|nr:uncharacterized protein GGS23DRAFT_376270 [Durotheca rogersii]KAI5866230.1 hypothetical protein GGS23DRAFT_376270 [Durotheca rogersii]
MGEGSMDRWTDGLTGGWQDGWYGRERRRNENLMRSGTDEEGGVLWYDEHVCTGSPPYLPAYLSSRDTHTFSLSRTHTHTHARTHENTTYTGCTRYTSSTALVVSSCRPPPFPLHVRVSILSWWQMRVWAYRGAAHPVYNVRYVGGAASNLGTPSTREAIHTHARRKGWHYESIPRAPLGLAQLVLPSRAPHDAIRSLGNVTLGYRSLCGVERGNLEW